MFQGWEPLQHPLNVLEVMSLWQRLLQGNEPHDYDIYIEAKLFSSTPFTQLFNKVIILYVGIANTNSWEPKDPKPMLHVLETWKNLLLDLVHLKFLDHIVMHKLKTTIDTWDPPRETVPIHAWLHPWLPFLG